MRDQSLHEPSVLIARTERSCFFEVRDAELPAAGRRSDTLRRKGGGSSATRQLIGATLGPHLCEDAERSYAPRLVKRSREVVGSPIVGGARGFPILRRGGAEGQQQGGQSRRDRGAQHATGLELLDGWSLFRVFSVARECLSVQATKFRSPRLALDADAGRR